MIKHFLIYFNKIILDYIIIMKASEFNKKNIKNQIQNENNKKVTIITNIQ